MSAATTLEDIRCDQQGSIDLHGDVVKVIVGEDKSIFHIHENILRTGSAFFDAALKEGWKEGQQRTVTLADDDAEVFYRYVQWLYTGRIACKVPEIAGCKLLASLYVLGEKLLAPTFRDAVVNAIVAEARNGIIPIDRSIDIIYTGTPPGSPARRLMVDLHVHLGKPDFISESLERTNHEFLRDLAKELLRIRHASSAEVASALEKLGEGVPCSYHCHEKDKRCGVHNEE